MFELLFQKPSALSRHKNAPYAKERALYLEHCAQNGYSRGTLLFKARELLWVARKLSVYPNLEVTLEQIEAVAKDWEERERCWGKKLNTQWTYRRFIETARPWLRFLGYLQEPVEQIPFVELLEDYVKWMKHERGLAPSTIQKRIEYIRQFLRWYGPQEHSFADIQLADVDAFLVQGSNNGWCRTSIKNMTTVLRTFFRYGALKGWCKSTLADAIQGPRVFHFEALPTGPAWPDVRRLLANMDTEHPGDLRDRPIMMLFSIYGLRSSEVAGLRLDDIDWENDLIHVSRVKRSSSQTYPLLLTVGNSIIQYLQNVRPQCTHREVFLTLLPPFRPLSTSALYCLVSKRMTALGIRTAHRGPHSLRHACAARLVTEGLSLKEIGDHLGHRSASATRIYAKVDLPALREVAAFDLGGLL